jgi:hypothetical protein
VWNDQVEDCLTRVVAEAGLSDHVREGTCEFEIVGSKKDFKIRFLTIILIDFIDDVFHRSRSIGEILKS